MNNPLKYTDPSGYISIAAAMSPYDSDPETGRPMGMSSGASGGWASAFGSNELGITGSSIYYDEYTGTYRNRRTGKTVSFTEAIKSYEIYTFSIKYLVFSGTRDNPYMHLNDIVFSTDVKNVALSAGDPPYNPGEIRQWEPSLMDLWSERKGVLGKLTYDLVDGISVTLQSFVRGPEARHLNGSSVAGNDRTDALVNTVAWSLSASGFLKAINSNNWLRIGWGYDKGEEVFRVAWGAGRNHVKDISNPALREFNIWLRQLGNGHWDIWRP